uniref:Uncharacterized protein n=1 Tax=Vitis vinifera TaxID=29760 RepID=F6HXE3_VITVI
MANPESVLINHVWKKNVKKATIEFILKMMAKEPSNALKPTIKEIPLSNPN